jgi:hypothetical protein
MLRIFVRVYLPICIRKWGLSSTGAFDPRKLLTNDVEWFLPMLRFDSKEKIVRILGGQKNATVVQHFLYF